MTMEGMAKRAIVRVLEETDHLIDPGSVASDLLAALDAAGYQIVPKEPTPAMRQAGAKPWTVYAEFPGWKPINTQVIYGAMLFAAPRP